MNKGENVTMMHSLCAFEYDVVEEYCQRNNTLLNTQGKLQSSMYSITPVWIKNFYMFQKNSDMISE